MLGLVAVLVILFLLVLAPPVVNAWSTTLQTDLTNQIQAFEDARSNVENDIQTMQAAHRGYLITREPRFLDAYAVAETQLPIDLQTLRDLAPHIRADLPGEVAKLEADVAQWQTQLLAQLEMIRQDDLAGAVADVSGGRSQVFFDAAVQQLDLLEIASREARATVATTALRHQLFASLLAVGLGLLALLPGAYMVRQFRHTTHLTSQLQEQRDRAEQATEAAQNQLSETRRRNQQLTTLNTLASVTSATFAVQRRAELLIDTLGPTLQADNAALWLAQEPQGELQLLATHGPETGSRMFRAMTGIPTPQVARLLTDSCLLIVADRQAQTAGTALLPAHEEQTIRSFALLPLRGREGSIGVMLLTARQPGVFQEDDLDYYTTLANQVGLVLENARLYEALSADRQRLQAIFDQSPEGILFADAESNTIMLANQAAMQLLDDSLSGRELNDPALIGRFLRPNGEPYSGAELPLQQSMQKAEEVRAEILVAQPSGQRVPVLLTSVPLRDNTASVQGVVAVLQNLSHLREVERLKSDFVAMVSHELRTPLTAIQGCAQTLLRAPENHRERTREFLVIIDEQSTRLQELVDNLLNLSQVEAGALRLRREPLQIERLIRSVARQAGEHMHGLLVQVDIPRPLPSISADPRRVEQVLLNLLDNARKASPPGGAITIAASVEGDQIQVTVRDQGPGIPAEIRERVFERFFQGEQIPGIGGSGLGLAISRALIEAHGGRIWVHDGGTAGAQLRFTLPLHLAELEVAPETPLAGAMRHAHHTAHILIVDDEASLRVVLETGLTNAGYTVGMVAEGTAAVEYAATERPDLIVLDLMLPGEHGLTVLQRLRDFTSVPVLILTASSDEQHIVRGLGLGADDYMVKPFKMDELVARIGALLRRSQGGDVQAGPVVLEVGDIQIDLARREVQRDGTQIELTPTEYRLLVYLARNTGQVLTHEQILQHVWGPEYGNESQYLWVHIGRLRQKIEQNPKNPRHILTERGAGYRFEP
jgi:DNA-binding response OmpR family regulator/signal transduction histidine kinase/CHASE3 domain sensor protein